MVKSKPFPVVMGMKKLSEEAALDLYYAMRAHFGWHGSVNKKFVRQPRPDEVIIEASVLDKLRRDLTTTRRQRELFSESLWQAWKAFSEEGPDAAEKFLRAVCINNGIMNESGARL